MSANGAIFITPTVNNAERCRINLWPAVPEWPWCQNADCGLTFISNPAFNYSLPYWDKLHPPELAVWSTLDYVLLSQAALYWAMLHPAELCCALLSYAAPYRAKLHPTKLCYCCTLLNHAAPSQAMLHSSELCRTPVSYAASNWAAALCFAEPTILKWANNIFENRHPVSPVPE